MARFRRKTGSNAVFRCSLSGIYMGVIISTASVAADDNPLAALFDLSLQELSSVKITGSTLQEESLQSVPSSVTVFGREEIRRMGFTRLDQLMNFVPGFQSYRSDAGSQNYVYSSRGRRVGNSGEDLLILLDGMRLNDDWSGGAVTPEPNFPLDNVERVEFIRGPGAAIYGNNAFLGVVNIITGNNREIDVAAGTENYRAGSFQWSQKYDNKLVSVFIHDESSDGEKLNLFDPDPSVQTQVTSRDPYQQRHIYLKGEVENFSAQVMKSYSRHDDFYNQGYIANGINFTERNNQYIVLEYDRRFFTFWEVSAPVHFIERKFELDTIQNQGTSLGFRAHPREIDKGINLTARYDNKKSTRGIIGVEYRETELKDNTLAIYGPVNSEFESAGGTRVIRGLFAQHQYRFHSKWESTVGFRLDKYTEFGERLSPRAALVYNQDNKNTFKLFYGEAFRAPTRLESNIENNPVIVGNPDLDPEISKTLELNWLRILDDGTLSVALFGVLIEDSIRQAETPDPRISLNAGEETISGIEIEWQQQLHKYWGIRTAFTWLADEASRINSESDLLMSLGLTYAKNKLGFSINGNYQSSKEDAHDPALTPDGYTRLDSWKVFSTKVSYQITPAVETYLFIDNLFDEEYLAPAGRRANTVGVPNNGIAGFLGINWKFD